LSPKRDQLLKMVVHSDAAGMPALADALTGAGARDLRSSAEQAQVRVECIVPAYFKGAVSHAMRAVQGSEERTFSFSPTLDSDASVGSGMIGMLPEAMPKADFLAMVKERFGCGAIRYADAPQEMIQRVAWCGGAGSFLIGNAISAGAHAFVTGDITYHKFFDNEDRLLLLDIGHHESEQFTSNLLHAHLSKTFTTFAVRLSEIKTNPVKYC